MSRHPSTKWAQRSDKVFVTIELPDAKDVKQTLQPDGHFYFSAKSGLDNIPYELDLELFDSVTVDESTAAVGLRNICYLVKKAETNWWPKLLKEEGKPPAFLKVDWDKWIDEHDEKENKSGDMDFRDTNYTKLDMGGADNEFDDEVDVAKTAIKGVDAGKKAESKKDEEHTKIEKPLFDRRRRGRHPTTKWAQRSDKVFITMEMPDGYNMSIALDTSSFFFTARRRSDGWPYILDLTFFDSIIVDWGERIVFRNDLTNKCLFLKKARNNWWPRLLEEEGKPPGFLKVDWDKWVDEEDEEENIIFGGIDIGDAGLVTQWRNEYGHILLMIFERYFTSPYEYLNMRMVCNNWRDVLTIPPPFLLPSEQIPFLLLPRKRNEPAGSIFCINYRDRVVPSALPLLAAHNEDYFFYIGSSHGWIFIGYPNSRISLFNPLIGARYDLPLLNTIPGIELVGERYHTYCKSDLERHFKVSTLEGLVNLVVASTNPSGGEDFIVLLVLRDDDFNFYSCRPKRRPHFWNIHPHHLFHAVDVTYFREKIYLISAARRIATVSFFQEDTVFADYELVNQSTLDRQPGTPFLLEHASYLTVVIVNAPQRIDSFWVIDDSAWRMFHFLNHTSFLAPGNSFSLPDYRQDRLYVTHRQVGNLQRYNGSVLIFNGWGDLLETTTVEEFDDERWDSEGRAYWVPPNLGMGL